MGYDLQNDRGEFRFSNGAWAFYLSIAKLYGWKPAGTLPPDGIEPRDRDGHYLSNDGQYVGTDDADRLAAALQAALYDIQSLEQMTNVGTVSAAPACQLTVLRQQTVLINPDMAHYLKEMIAFFRSGRFRIL